LDNKSYKRKGIMELMERRGEITTTQLIGLALSIIGFAIVLILLFSLEFESYSNDELCRLSVLTRATSPSLAQAYVPLKCTTKKICITDKDFWGGNCPQFDGEKNIEYVRLKGSDSEKAEKIEEVSAKAMYNCWKMMGEGKLDLFAQEVNLGTLGIDTFLKLKDAKPSCVICSRVALGEDLTKNTDKVKSILDRVDVNRYLAEKNVEGMSISYLDYFAGGRNVQGYSKKFEEKIGNAGKKAGVDEIAFLFMQIKTEDNPEDALLEGFTTGGGFVLAGAAGMTGGTALLNPKTWVAALVTGIGAGGFRGYGAYRDQQISAGYCGDFSSKEEGKKGCSILIPADYRNVSQINGFCRVIEGSP